MLADVCVCVCVCVCVGCIHIDYFCTLANVSNAAMNIGVHEIFELVNFVFILNSNLKFIQALMQVILTLS